MLLAVSPPPVTPSLLDPVSDSTRDAVELTIPLNSLSRTCFTYRENKYKRENIYSVAVVSIHPVQHTHTAGERKIYRSAQFGLPILPYSSVTWSMPRTHASGRQAFCRGPSSTKQGRHKKKTNEPRWNWLEKTNNNDVNHGEHIFRCRVSLRQRSGARKDRTNAKVTHSKRKMLFLAINIYIFILEDIPVRQGS